VNGDYDDMEELIRARRLRRDRARKSTKRFGLHPPPGGVSSKVRKKFNQVGGDTAAGEILTVAEKPKTKNYATHSCRKLEERAAVGKDPAFLVVGLQGSRVNEGRDTLYSAT